MMPRGVVERLRSNPRVLFVVDAVGATLSAVMLGVVLVRLEGVFGIPRPTLYLLAAFPCIFALYDLSVYAWVRRNLERPLERIAYLNVGYCVLSLGLALYHRDVITLWGWAYILAEVSLVVALAMIELGTARERRGRDG